MEKGPLRRLAQQLRVLAAKPAGQSPMPGITEMEKRTLKIVL